MLSRSCSRICPDNPAFSPDGRHGTVGRPRFLLLLSLLLLVAVPARAQISAQVWPSKVTREAEPEKPLTQDVLITNRSTVAAVVRVRTMDWTLSQSGDLQLLPFGTSAHSLASCMTISPTSFSLAPGESRTVTASLTMPADGEPTRWGLILQEIRSTLPHRGAGPLAVGELGTTVYLTRAPEDGARAQLTALDVNPQGLDSMRVRLSVQNDGQRHLYAGGDIQLTNDHGAVVRTGTFDKGVVLPGTVRDFAWTCAGALAPGHYKVTASLDTGNPYLLVGEKAFAWSGPASRYSWLGALH
jgi:P pilus assembly chaperone PapD